MSRRMIRIFCSLLLVGIGLGLQGVNAADLSVEPSIEVRPEFDSNIDYSYRSRISDYIFNFPFNTAFNYATETTKLQGKLFLLGQHFISHPNLDTINQNYSISGRRQVTPRLGLGLSGSYIMDRTMGEELLESGLVIGRTRRTSYGISPSLTYALTEQLLTLLSYDFYKVDYQSPRYREYSRHTVRFVPEYSFANQKTTLSGIITGNFVEYTTGDRYDTLGTYLGVKHRFSDTWDVSLFGGANFTWSSVSTITLDFLDFFVVLPRLKRQNAFAVNPYIALSSTKLWTNAKLTGGYYRTQAASGSATLQETNSLYAEFGYDLTKRLNAALRGELFLTQSTQERGGYNQSYFTVTPTINYQLTENFSLTSKYIFGRREDTERDRSTHRHRVWLGLTYTYPLHYAW